jgi:hypothetical protein
MTARGEDVFVAIGHLLITRLSLNLFSPANVAETAEFAYVHECRRVH